MNLSGKGLHNVDFPLFTNAFSRNTILTKLDLSRSFLGTREAEALAEALRVNSTLQSLDISNTHLDAEGWCCIRKALDSRNGALRQLIIGGNDMIFAHNTDMGNGLDRLMETQTGLMRLSLSGTCISAKHAQQIFGALHGNTTLLHLAMGEIVMPPHDLLRMVAQALRGNRTIARLDFDGNNAADGDDALMFSAATDLMQTIADTPRRNCLTIHGIDLGKYCAAAEQLIANRLQPQGESRWDNKMLMHAFESVWRAMLLAFAMGMHSRLCEKGGDGQRHGIRSSVYILDSNVMTCIGEAYWGALASKA